MDAALILPRAAKDVYDHRSGIPGLRASALVVVVVVAVVLLHPGGIPLAVLVLYELMGQVVRDHMCVHEDLGRNFSPSQENRKAANTLLMAAP